MALQIVHHPGYDAGFRPDHRFPMSKYPLLMQELRLRGLAEPDNLHQPDMAPAELLSLAHDPAYVDAVIACEVEKEIERDIGFAVDERVSRRARFAAAGTLLAATIALERGIACNTAGGSHHARRAKGAGFCTFNDVAVAAAALISTGQTARVLVIDLDVHQGDGTADIFAGDDRVFTFSMHGANNYPHPKAVSDLDIGLPDMTGDDAYLDGLGDALGLLAQRFPAPDIVFYNAGVDPHADDRLGRLALSDKGLRARDRMVLAHCRAADLPVCGVIGGGYSRDVPALAARHAILFEVASEFA